MARQSGLLRGLLLVVAVVASLVAVGTAKALSKATERCDWRPPCGPGDAGKFAIPCDGHCNKYAQCSDSESDSDGAEWQTKSCFWPWQRFSPETRECVMLPKVNCDWWKSREGEKLPDLASTEAPITAPPAPASAEEPPCEDVQCPASGKALLPNPCPKSCQKYFSCESGKATPKLCLPWQNFDPVSAQCIEWYLVDCNWANPGTTPAAPAPTLPPQSTTTTPKPPCSFTPSCAARRDGARIADPCRCQAYYACNEGAATHQLCMPWQNFDPIALECAWFSTVDCGWPSKTTTTEAPATATTEATATTTTEAPEPTTTEAPEPTTTEAPEPTTTEVPEPTSTEAPEATITEAPEPTTTEAPEPTTPEAPEPTTTEAPEPTTTEAPEPTATEAPEPTSTEAPEPTTTEAPEPTTTETPEPGTTEAPEPTTTEAPEPTTTETPEPAITEAPATTTTEAPETTTTVAPEPTTTETPTTIEYIPPTIIPGCSFVPNCPAKGKTNLAIPCPNYCKHYIACKNGSYSMKKCSWYQPYFDSKSRDCALFGAVCAA